MSRNADEGFCLYEELYNKGIEIVRLNGKQIGQNYGQGMKSIKDRWKLCLSREKESVCKCSKIHKNVFS